MWNWLGTSPAVPPAGEASEETTKAENADANETDPPATEDESKSSGLIPAPTDNVKQAATQLGSYLFSFASAATNVAANTASKLKDSATVHLDKTIIGDFNRENEKFKQENEARRIGDGVPPWVGYHEETSMKRQILALSLDERNFMRSPPSGVDFVFEIEHKMPIAMATLKEDENLRKMRFTLVPKKITEEFFWRNYFYRVSLIKQSTQLSSLADQEMSKSPHSSSTESLNKSVDKIEVDVDQEELTDELVDLPSAESPVTSEFVSDSFQVDGGLSEEERNQLMIETAAVEPSADHSSAIDENENQGDDWDLDKELQDEIESFELVNENTTEDDDGNWEKEIEDLIELET